MFANTSTLELAGLTGTVQALRALRSEITRALAQLERGFVEETPPR